MDQAWLDELSEDWLSEPRSPTSSHPSLQKTKTKLLSSSRRSSTSSSRIPIPKSRSSSEILKDGALPLGERSLSNKNISPAKPASRRLSTFQSEPGRGRKTSRTFSASTSISTQPNTIQKKSLSSSPVKDRQSQDTLEWKRRLLYGDVAYGEKCDLFSPTGLEKLFSRPPTRDSPATKEKMSTQESGIVFPSSPPSYLPARPAAQQIQERAGRGTPWPTLEEEDESIIVREVVEESLTGSVQAEKSQPANSRRGPKAPKYKMVDTLSSQDFSENDLSHGSNFLLDKALRTSAQRKKSNISQEFSREASSDPGSRTRERSNSLPNRMVSGQSNQSNITRDEGLTPIYVTLSGSAANGGGITYRRGVEWDALDLADSGRHLNPEELHDRLQAVDGGSKTPHSDEASLLLEETRDTTEDFAHNGHFVNIGRGGRSAEGSFRRRPLSPSSLPPIDELRSSREASPHIASPRIPKIRMTQPSSIQEISEFSPIPKASRSPSPIRVDGAKTSSGASQLKIFGSHDTFTSKKLLRRLSQFEETFQETGDLGDEDFPTTSPKLDRRGTASTVRNTKDSRTDVDGPGKATSPSKKPKRISNFGEGDLDDYDFSDGISAGSDGKTNGWRRSISGFKWNDQIEEAGERVLERWTKHKTANVDNTVELEGESRPTSSSSAGSKSSGQKEVLDTPRKARNGGSAGKRLRLSPYKDPTPKRRRTLMPADVNDVNSAQEQSERIQFAKSGKRKDARHQNDREHADPNVIANRQILRPRAVSRVHSSPDRDSQPNSSQSSEMSDELRQELEEHTNQLSKIHAEMAFEMPSKPAKPFGHFPHLQGSRKASITTQDYVDEAKKIMAAIRYKADRADGARPISAMTSNESELEHAPRPSDSLVDTYGDSDEDSTPEAFERPPSREGNRPIPRMPHKQEDPEIIKHLKKYQETQEKPGFDDAVASSMKQLSLARAATKMAGKAERSASATISRIAAGRIAILPETFESDPPNIRIIESSAFPRKRKHETSETNNGEDGLLKSQGSSGSSTFPSTSSRGSERHVIAPEKINHLIPEQVAGMVFDRERNIWIKHKVASAESKGPNPLPSEDTDDDPFGDIPDLSVDETREMQGVKASAARKREELRSDPMPPVEEVSEEIQGFKGDSSDADLEEISAEQFSRALSAGATYRTTDSKSPQRGFWTNDNSIITNPYQSPEVHHNDAPLNPDSRQNKDTFNRVTAMITELKARAAGTTIPEPDLPDVAKGKQYAAVDDGNSIITPKPARNVTIQFSSPIASIIKDVAFETSFSSEWDEDSQMGNSLLNRSRNSTPSIIRHSSIRKSSLKIRSAFSSAPPGISSINKSAFPIRQVSTINEQDEDSIVVRLNPETNRRSLSLIKNPSPMVSPPPPACNDLQVSKPRTPSNDSRQVDLRFDASFNLTPLSEFTIHHPDQSLALDVSYLGERRHHEPSTKSRTLSVSVNQLVEKLTDLEPYEPYWEYMKDIELRNKALSSLHMLDEFCEALVELDASHNKIDQTDGIPTSVRHLKVSHNSISDLTSWGHLINLQYVDVSNNDLTSLRGFKNLVHLRSLRADNNSITSLDGVMNLDGLLSLRLRGNQLESVDFMDTALKRLTDLDLKGNGLTNIYNIHELQSLVVLNLEENDLEIFSAPPQSMFFSLKYLKLSGNKISRINVSRYPNLRLLYLDRNCLGKVSGLFKTKYLDSLSMREQRDGSILDMAFLDEVYEIRKLFLSGNLLQSFDPHVDFLNLQLLELANCGLQSIPHKFGQLMANIRVLNLNFNAIKDLSPLLGIVRLKKLHLAGNRFSKLRITASILSQFVGLSKLDIRNNPITQGFYPTALEKRIIFQENGAADAEEVDVMDAEPFTLGMADAGLDVRYSARLDLETRLLRRIYEMWVVDGCPRLKILDGLVVDKGVLKVRDETYDALVKAGVLREKSGKGQVVVSRDAEGEDEDIENERDGDVFDENSDSVIVTEVEVEVGTPSNPNQNEDSINQDATNLYPHIPIKECDTPRRSIERDYTISSTNTTTHINTNYNMNINTRNGNEDDEWDEFDENDALPVPSPSPSDDEGEAEMKQKSSSIWGAEDSFA